MHPYITKFMTCSIFVITVLMNSAWASESFRLDNGKLIYTGMSKLALQNVAGQPISTETIQHLNKHGEHVDSDEQRFIYKLEGSIGGEYLVEARLSRGKVIALEVTQSNR